MWQELHQELADHGLTVITVALDRSIDDAGPHIKAAGATHPSLVDTEHVVADRYNMVNVPTVVWIDEEGRIVRPNDVHYVSNEYSSVTQFHSRKPIEALRAWVLGQAPAMIDPPPMPVPAQSDQEARATFALAWWLAQNGQSEAAEGWFQRAGELAPHDFTIRRGSMPIRGIDASGPKFFEMITSWRESGHDYYLPLSDTATTPDDYELQPVPQHSIEDIRRLEAERLSRHRS